MKKKSGKGRYKTLWIIVLSFIVVIVAARYLWLPSFILKQVNKELQRIDGYEGSVKDIDLFVLAGAYTIKGIELNKKDGKIPVPFFAADKLDLSVEWKALFKGEIVGEIEAEHITLNYVNGPTKATTQTSVDKDWIQVVDELMPLRINRFEVKNSEIHFRDFHKKPKVDLQMEQVYILATNLTNANDEEKLLPSSVIASAKLYDGEVKLNMHINPLQRSPAFDMNAELTSMNLKNLNDFFKAYGKFDVQKGTFSVYTEAATRNNKIVGYVKPIIKDIDVAALKKEEGNILQTAWEGVVGFVAWIFKNQPKDQLATEIKFEGKLNKPDIDLFSIIGEMLQNAFIKALMPTIENSVSIGSVNKIEAEKGAVNITEKGDKKQKKKGFIKRLFEKKDDKDGKDEKEKDKNEKEDKKEENNDKKQNL